MRSTFFKSLILVFVFSSAVLLPVWWIWYRWNGEKIAENQTTVLAKYVLPELATSRIAALHQRFGRFQSLWILNESGVPIDASSLMRLRYRELDLPLPHAGETVTQTETNGALYAVVQIAEEPKLYAVIFRAPFSIWNHPYLLGAVFSMLLTTLVSLSVLLIYLRQKARHAEQVLARLQTGDLSARLSIDTMDSVGQFSAKFNRMAEEIEALVVKLRHSERSRMQIIEELSHDLRTPLTSILTLFESIADAKEFSPEYVRECVGIALPEIDYVNLLIRDLFLIAQFSEPNYRPIEEPIDLAELLDNEVRHFSALALAQNKSLRYELSNAVDAKILGDSHLLKRLIRNILTNASRFAGAKVSVELTAQGSDVWSIRVSDDGEGFARERLDAFGTERPNLEGKTSQSTSLGLGSVIARKIATFYGGDLRTMNQLAPDGRVEGAVVEIVLHFKSPVSTAV